MTSLPSVMRTFSVTVEHHYGDIYVNWQTITLDATSEEEAKRVAELLYPESWDVKAVRVLRHEHCGW